MKTNLQAILAFAVLGFLTVGVVTAQTTQIVGGYGDAANNDKDVVAAANFAVGAKSKQNSKLNLISIDRAEKQVVAGLNYRLCLTVKDARAQQQATAIVYQNLQNKMSLTSWTNGDCAAESGTATTPKTEGQIFKGFINGARFEMNLQRANDELTGSYFYVKSGGANRLKLNGKIDANGNFTMRETDAGNKQTGEFKGVWKDDANSAGATLEGDWKRPTDKDASGFGATEQLIFLTGDTQLKTQRTVESIKAKKSELKAEYPELTNNTSAANFNQLVKSRVTKELGAFRKDVSALTAADLKMTPAEIGNYIEISYDIAFADNDLISVNFLESTFEGGAHPNYNYFTINYDLKNNRELKLADLFKPNANYLNAVSSFATKDLQNRKDPTSGENRGLAQDIFKDGALPKAENYANWNLTRKGLMFTFAPYQVASYADGTQTVVVPYTEIKNIAKSDGAVAKFDK